MSLTDTCGMLHDTSFSLSRNRADNLTAERAFGKNLMRMVTHFGEPYSNIRTAYTMQQIGEWLGTNAGSEGKNLREMKSSGMWATNRPVYERLLSSLKASGLGLDFGFLEAFHDGGNSFNLASL